MFSGAEVVRGWKIFFEINFGGKRERASIQVLCREKGLLVFNPEQGNFTTRVSIFHAA